MLLLLLMSIGCASSESADETPPVATDEAPPVATVDTTVPTAGNTGAILATPANDSVDLSWTAATDNVTPANELLYKVFYSSNQADVETLTAINNATEVNGFTADLISKTVSGLTADTTYFFNVIVQDAAGNETLYVFKEAKTLDIVAPVLTNSVISVTGAPSDTLDLSWTAATDTQGISYKIYYSTNVGMDTVANIENNGTLAETVTDTNTTLTGMPDELLYFNVIAIDASDNKAAYTMTSVDNKQQLSGKVVDGYIANATVCFDKNDNAACDAGEPSAMTDASGDYQQLQIPRSELSQHLVPTLIIEGGTDISSGKPFLGLLQAPILPGFSTANITPLTGLLTAKLKAVGTEITTAAIDEAKEEIANSLGLSNVDITDDPIEVAKNNVDGKKMLKKTLQVQKMIEVIAAAEQDQTGEGSIVKRKKAKSKEVMEALADKMDVADGGAERSFEGIIDDIINGTGFPQLFDIKDALMTINQGIDRIFAKAEDVSSDIDDAEILQIGAVADRLAGDVEKAIDTTKQGGGTLNGFDVDTIIDYDVSDDAFLQSMDVETLISKLGLSVGTGDATGDLELTQSQWDNVVNIFSTGTYKFNAQTSVEYFWKVIKDESESAFTGVQSKFETAFDSYQLKYPNRLDIDNKKHVSLEGQIMSYFTVSIDEAGEYDFFLTRTTGDSTPDLSDVDLFSLHENVISEEDFDRPAAIEMVVTNQSGSSVRLLSADVLTAGTYWLKIKNDVPVSFNLIAKKHVVQKGLNLEISLRVGDYDPEAYVFINKDSGMKLNDCVTYRFFPEDGESFVTVSLTDPAGVGSPMELSTDDASYYEYQKCDQGEQLTAADYYTVTVNTAGETDPEERYFYINVPSSIAEIEVPEVGFNLKNGSIDIESFIFSNVTIDNLEGVGVNLEGVDNQQLGSHYPLIETNWSHIEITEQINAEQVQSVYFSNGHSDKRIRFVYQWNLTNVKRDLSVIRRYRNGVYLTNSGLASSTELTYDTSLLLYEIQNDIGPSRVVITYSDKLNDYAEKTATSTEEHLSYELEFGQDWNVGTYIFNGTYTFNVTEGEVAEPGGEAFSKTFDIPSDSPMPSLEFTMDGDDKITSVTLTGDYLPTGTDLNWHLELHMTSGSPISFTRDATEDSIDFSTSLPIENDLKEIVCSLVKNGIKYTYHWTAAEAPKPPWGFTTFKFLASNNNYFYGGISAGDILCAINPETFLIICDDHNYDINGYGMDSLIPTFEFLGKSVSVDSVEQVNEVTPHNFWIHKIYTVTAEDNSTRDYIVFLANKAGYNYYVDGLVFRNVLHGGEPPKMTQSDAVSYCRNVGGDDFHYQLPSVTELSSLLSDEGIVNSITMGLHDFHKDEYYWSATAVDDSDTHTYGVKSKSYDWQRYSESRSLENTEEHYVRCMYHPYPVIASFKFLAENNNALDMDVVGTINGNIINITFPDTTDVSSLVATFETPTFDGKNVVQTSVDNVVQTSNETVNDFSGDVIYTLLITDHMQESYVFSDVNRFKVVVTLESANP